MFHKKKQIWCIALAAAAVTAVIAVLLHSSPKGRLSSLSVSDAVYAELKDSRQPSDSELLQGLWLNDRQTFFDRETDTFYYSLIEGEPDRFDPKVTADGTGVRLAVLTAPLDEDFVRSNGTVKLLACSDTSYQEYSLKLTTLPLLNIVTEKEITKNFPVTFTMEFFDNRMNAPVHYSTSIGTIHLRGASSLVYPKQSFKINLKSSIGKTKARDANLLGLRENNEWILYAPYADRDRVRSVFTAAMWKESCAEQNSFEIDNGYEFRYVEVFLNGSYHGIFALGYMPDEVQLQVDSSVGEVMYKNQDWFDYETDADSLEESFKVVDAFDGLSSWVTEDAYQPLRTYISQLQNARSPEELRDTIDWDTFENLYLFTNVTQGFDCARDTRAKNYYITAKRVGDSYKMLYTPWDLDITWGKYFSDYPMRVEENYFFPFGPFRGFPPEEDPDRFAELCDRYHTLRSTSWSDDALMEILDDCEAQVFDSGAYARDKERWPDSDLLEGQTDLSGFKDYVMKRMAYCDDYYAGN